MLLKAKVLGRTKVVVSYYIPISRELIKAHKGVILCADIMFINEVPFLVMYVQEHPIITSRFRTRRKSHYWKHFDATFIKYNKAGFVIKELHADPEFECIEQEMGIQFTTMNLNTAEEHQSDIERLFRVIKEIFSRQMPICHVDK